MSNCVFKKGDVIKGLSRSKNILWSGPPGISNPKILEEIYNHDKSLVISVFASSSTYYSSTILKVLTSKGQVGYLCGTVYGPSQVPDRDSRWLIINDDEN